MLIRRKTLIGPWPEGKPPGACRGTELSLSCARGSEDKGTCAARSEEERRRPPS